MVGQNIFAVVTAAGSGTRLGFSIPKALVPLAGSSLVARAVDTFLEHPQVLGVVVTAPPESPVFEQFVQLFEGAKRVLVVPGGASRQESVYRGLGGLEKLAESLGIGDKLAETKVLIHDAARCLLPAEVVDRVAGAVGTDAAVVPVMPVVDTLTQVVYQGDVEAGAAENSGGEKLYAGQAVERSELRAVQTPQGFTYATILKAHQLARTQPDVEFTDDASLMRLVQVPVRLVPGSELSLKITTPFDLQVAECLLGFAGALGKNPVETAHLPAVENENLSSL